MHFPYSMSTDLSNFSEINCLSNKRENPQKYWWRMHSKFFFYFLCRLWINLHLYSIAWAQKQLRSVKKSFSEGQMLAPVRKMMVLFVRPEVFIAGAPCVLFFAWNAPSRQFLSRSAAYDILNSFSTNLRQRNRRVKKSRKGLGNSAHLAVHDALQAVGGPAALLRNTTAQARIHTDERVGCRVRRKHMLWVEGGRECSLLSARKLRDGPWGSQVRLISRQACELVLRWR